MKLAHIVSPVKVTTSSDLHFAQPVTFRSMRLAKSTCDVEVDLFCINYLEGQSIAPKDFINLPNLSRSINDLGQFSKVKPLPIISDILEALHIHSDADYFIYTNVDIGLMPFFYEEVARLLKSHDALVINRRTIAPCYDSELPLSQCFSQVGEIHPGFDCFIFPRELFNNYYFADTVAGANWIGRVFIVNLLAYATSFKILEDAHLTFHFGDDRSWKTVENIPFDEHNEEQLAHVMRHIELQGRLDAAPLLKKTYEEFVTKMFDPDPTRPKRYNNEMKPVSFPIDRGQLFEKLKHSNAWNDESECILRQDPIFITGYPRSGTSLFQSLMAAQMNVSVFPETQFFSLVRQKLNLKNDQIQKDCLTSVLSTIKQKLEISEILESYITDMVESGKLSPKMLFEVLVYDQLARHNSEEDISKIRWIEKTPHHVYHDDVIWKYYPKAKIVFLLRNPEKAIVSRRKHFVWEGYDESVWPIETHAKEWVNSIRSAEAMMEKKPDQVLFIKFEDLVKSPESTITEVCKFVNVSFDRTRLSGYRRYSEQQSHDWESWKKESQNDMSSEIAFRKGTSLNKVDKEVLLSFAGEKLRKYGYLDPVAKTNSFYARIKGILRQ